MNHDNPLCNNCGACCRDHVPVAADDAVPADLTFVDADGRRWMRPHEIRPWCGALDVLERRCTIYDQRPRACRVFEVDGRDCHRARQLALRVV
jgi:Fe-S-cluster containining protein